MARMDVRSRSPIGGCLMAFLAPITLGVVPLYVWYDRRRYPAALDDAGVTLRSGKLIPWADVTRWTRIKHYVNGRYVTDIFELRARGRTSRFDVRCVENPDAVAAFIQSRVPPSALAPAK